jgi:hypothetical protein
MKMGRRIGNKQKVEYPSNKDSLCKMDEKVLETKHTNSRQSQQNIYRSRIYYPWETIDSQCLQFIQAR